MEAERDVEVLLSLIADEANLSILPRIRGALALIERCAAFEGDGDLATAHLFLQDVARDLGELCDRADQALSAYSSERRAPVLELVGDHGAV